MHTFRGIARSSVVAVLIVASIVFLVSFSEGIKSLVVRRWIAGDEQLGVVHSGGEMNGVGGVDAGGMGKRDGDTVHMSFAWNPQAAEEDNSSSQLTDQAATLNSDELAAAEPVVDKDGPKVIYITTTIYQAYSSAFTPTSTAVKNKKQALLDVPNVLASALSPNINTIIPSALPVVSAVSVPAAGFVLNQLSSVAQVTALPTSLLDGGVVPAIPAVTSLVNQLGGAVSAAVPVVSNIPTPTAVVGQNLAPTALLNQLESAISSIASALLDSNIPTQVPAVGGAISSILSNLGSGLSTISGILPSQTGQSGNGNLASVSSLLPDQVTQVTQNGISNFAASTSRISTQAIQSAVNPTVSAASVSQQPTRASQSSSSFTRAAPASSQGSGSISILQGSLSSSRAVTNPTTVFQGAFPTSPLVGAEGPQTEASVSTLSCGCLSSNLGSCPHGSSSVSGGYISISYSKYNFGTITACSPSVVATFYGGFPFGGEAGIAHTFTKTETFFSISTVSICASATTPNLATVITSTVTLSLGGPCSGLPVQGSSGLLTALSIPSGSAATSILQPATTPQAAAVTTSISDPLTSALLSSSRLATSAEGSLSSSIGVTGTSALSLTRPAPSSSTPVSSASSSLQGFSSSSSVSIRSIGGSSVTSATSTNTGILSLSVSGSSTIAALIPSSINPQVSLASSSRGASTTVLPGTITSSPISASSVPAVVGGLLSDVVGAATLLVGEASQVISGNILSSIISDVKDILSQITPLNPITSDVGALASNAANDVASLAAVVTSIVGGVAAPVVGGAAGGIVNPVLNDINSVINQLGPVLGLGGNNGLGGILARAQLDRNLEPQAGLVTVVANEVTSAMTLAANTSPVNAAATAVVSGIKVLAGGTTKVVGGFLDGNTIHLGLGGVQGLSGTAHNSDQKNPRNEPIVFEATEDGAATITDQDESARATPGSVTVQVTSIVTVLASSQNPGFQVIDTVSRPSSFSRVIDKRAITDLLDSANSSVDIEPTATVTLFSTIAVPRTLRRKITRTKPSPFREQAATMDSEEIKKFRVQQKRNNSADSRLVAFCEENPEGEACDLLDEADGVEDKFE